MARSILSAPELARRLALCALLAALVPAMAHADGNTRARGLFKQAQKAYDTGRFSDALRDYTAAYELKPLPGLLFDIAQCQRQLGNDERAAFFYQRYLETAGDTPAAQTARKLLAEVEARQAERKKQEQADAEARRQKELDDARADAARAEADAASKRKAELDAKQAFDARAQAERAAAARAEPSPVAPAPEVAASPPLTHRWWFWTGIGAAAVAAGAVVYVATLPRAPDGTLGTINAR